MNAKANGNMIERVIIESYGLSPDTLGFDAKVYDYPVEIKGCLRSHKNGLDSKGNERIVKGRFWIDNRAHKLLLKENGIYIFALYQVINEEVKIVKSMVVWASSLDKFIRNGGNTKLPYDFILSDVGDSELSCL